ncbi:MAG: hypothetical protein NTV61_04565 [Candidatus Bathyarchaeota archaeon]|nr:hypothetical protein [Candidatus Bathyarchaeota archaeon]
MSDSPEKETEPKAVTKEKKSDPIIEQMQEIIGKVEQIPEYYRMKAFEVLLNQKLTGTQLPFEIVKHETKSEPVPTGKFIIPIDVRAFLQQYEVAEEKLKKLFLMQDKEVRPTYQITTTKKSRSQIQIALLVALETALKGGKFEFNAETVRTRCQELKSYDQPNFQANFKNNQSLFKSLADPEHVELSPDGKSALADVISEIVK